MEPRKNPALGNSVPQPPWAKNPKDLGRLGEPFSFSPEEPGLPPVPEFRKPEIARFNLARAHHPCSAGSLKAEVLEWFAQSDILFMPSLSEGLPVVGVQALAKGLALVVSKIGGFLDLVNEGQNGFLIDNPDQYEDALRQLLDDPQKLSRFKKASRKKAEEFSIKRIVDRYETLLSTCR